MNVSCQLSINLDLSISHRTFEDDKNVPVFPVFRNLKRIFVHSFFVGKLELFAVSAIVATIIVFAKPLLLPLRWHLNLRPDSTVSS